MHFFLEVVMTLSTVSRVTIISEVDGEETQSSEALATTLSALRMYSAGLTTLTTVTLPQEVLETIRYEVQTLVIGWKFYTAGQAMTS